MAVEWGGLEGVEEVELVGECGGQGFGDMRGLRSWKGGGRKLSEMAFPYVGCGEVFRGKEEDYRCCSKAELLCPV